MITPGAFVSTSYDYLIAGGGTAGLTLAARLTEDPRVTVAVIEAGIDRTDDPLVKTWALSSGMYGRPEYDWIYQTEPQVSFNLISNSGTDFVFSFNLSLDLIVS